MSDMELEKIRSQEIWVNVAEAAEITGYSFDSVRNLVQRLAKQPEAEREVSIRKRAHRWEMWLPDLMKYVEKPGRGSHAKRKSSEEAS
jgi:hypothetical protein